MSHERGSRPFIRSTLRSMTRVALSQLLKLLDKALATPRQSILDLVSHHDPFLGRITLLSREPGQSAGDRYLAAVDGVNHVEHVPGMREIGFRQDNRKSALLESGDNLCKAFGQHRRHAFERFVEQ